MAFFGASVQVQSVLDRNTPDRVHRPCIGRLQALNGAVLSGPSINTFLRQMPAQARSIPVSTLTSTARSVPWLFPRRRLQH
jgi:hypothetical protein